MRALREPFAHTSNCQKLGPAFWESDVCLSDCYFQSTILEYNIYFLEYDLSEFCDLIFTFCIGYTFLTAPFLSMSCLYVFATFLVAKLIKNFTKNKQVLKQVNIHRKQRYYLKRELHIY